MQHGRYIAFWLAMFAASASVLGGCTYAILCKLDRIAKALEHPEGSRK